MKKNINTYSLLILSIFIPSVSFAALEGVVTLVTDFKNVINLIIPTLFALALVYFFWGVGQFILHDAGNDKTREDGKKKILWGIIALFILASIFGIVAWISSTLGVGSGSSSPNNNPSGSCPTGHYLDELGDCVPYI
jgi:hypothetical protein